MLLRFGFENFLSIDDYQELSLSPSSLDDGVSSVIESNTINNIETLSAAVIYGANASGKSNVINGLKRMRQEVMSSHSRRGPDMEINRSHFALNDKAISKPTGFEVDFVQNNVRYHYGFKCDDKQYLSEWLYGFPNGKSAKYFEREKQEFSFGRMLKGRNKVISDLTRKNSLFISTATQNDHTQLSEISSFFRNIESNSTISVNAVDAISKFTGKDVDSRVINFLNEIGTGVCAYETEERDIPETTKKMVKAFLTIFNESPEGPDAPLDNEVPDTQSLIRLGHLNNSGKTVFFDLQRESAGTRRLLVMLMPVFKALDDGSLIVIDEFDASLHTKACELIIALFSDKIINKNGAQLVVTTHDTNLLRSNYLRRDQIWFTEKDNHGATHLYPLTDIRTKKSDNLEKGYLQGRFGAVPFAGSPLSLLEKSIA